MVERRDERIVKTLDEARGIARQYAVDANIPEERVVAAADNWFDAGKDHDAARGSDLVNFLARRVGTRSDESVVQLFVVLQFAFSGKHPGKVLVDDHEMYRHWLDDANVVHVEVKGSDDFAFADQSVRFDDRGIASVTDVGGKTRRIRVLVLRPFRKLMLAEALISERQGAND